MQLRKASRKRQHLRIALQGPTGSGKTYSAFRIGMALAARNATKWGVVDTENGSAELYQGDANPDGGTFEFEVIDLAAEPGKFSIPNYLRAIDMMREAGVGVLVIDSISHAWAGEGGVLQFVDGVAAKQRAKGGAGSSFSAWAEATPEQHKFVQALLSYPGDLVCTMRSKMDYVLENVNGKQVPRRIGLNPVQRDGIEYEFTVVGDIEQDTHKLTISKTRCSRLDGQSYRLAGKEVATILGEWRDSGAEVPPPAVEPPWKVVYRDANPDKPWGVVFREALSALPLSVPYGMDTLAAYCVSRGWPPPAEQSPTGRARFVDSLSDPEKHATMAKWCDDHIQQLEKPQDGQ